METGSRRRCEAAARPPTSRDLARARVAEGGRVRDVRGERPSVDDRVVEDVCDLGLGRIVALCRRSSASYQIC
jgi:hypothetical protein